ncbi:hypothetical protein ACQ5ES_11535 [Pseudidiomarina sp. E22-M8]|uniref:hypothetical protein n=1 Tax=Pseudidiomarina sp. E22-M8 TaxID=3424768 RepID=UPI00403D13DC
MNEASTPSTADPQSQLWTKSQREALAALKLPLWQKAAAKVADASDAATATSYFYKLQDWLLICPAPLPVTLQSWQQDVLRTLAPDNPQQPTEVSASVANNSANAKYLELPELTLAELSAVQKRDLWMRICKIDD